MKSLINSMDGQLLDGLDFCSKTYALYEKIKVEPNGVDRLRLRSGEIEKRLLDELLPICRYIQTYYRVGRYISVRWVNGCQSYDAELHQSGELISQGYYSELAYLEVTCAMHKNEHWIRKLLTRGEVTFAPEGVDAKKGTPPKSVPKVFANNEHVQNFVPIVVALIKQKLEINYPTNTSLVVQCHLNSLYTSYDWRLLIKEVELQISSAKFREILLFDGTTERTTPLAFNQE